jgi:hypothetical protein
MCKLGLAHLIRGLFSTGAHLKSDWKSSHISSSGYHSAIGNLASKTAG